MGWNIKEKIPQQGNEEEILTPDYHQILVGADEDQVLIYQEAFNNWSQKERNPEGDWSYKTKVLS